MTDSIKLIGTTQQRKSPPFANCNASLYATVLGNVDPWKGRAIEPHFTGVNENNSVKSGTALWDKFAHEKRIELAFEEHRYFSRYPNEPVNCSGNYIKTTK